jgi:DNA polymerase-3 subunit alpha
MDIDTDFEFLRKDDVLKEEAEDYGYDCFAKIETFGTMKAKNVLKGCAKVSGIENHVAIGNKLAKFILDDKQTLKKAWDTNEDFQAYVHSDPRLEKIFEIALKLEGTKKSAGTHACGHIPTPVPCEQLFPCRLDTESGYLVCEYDKDQAEHLGNLKKDLLMLRNLTIIDTAQKEIERRTGKKIPLWTEEILNDKKALEMIAAGDTNGVFQLESDGMKRPGPMEYIPDYIRNKHNPSCIKYAAPELKPILESTYGIIVYQEQVMLIVQAIAGFSMGRADVVRKAMGKKKEDIMRQEGIHFVYGDEELGIEGCINHGIKKAVAEDLWSQMEDFGKYAFNKSHAAAYAAISMQTAYLKANYPLEFAVGLLTSVMDDSKKLMKYVNSYRAMGVNILPPDVRNSEYGFSIEEDKNKNESIRFGLFALKGVGEGIATSIPKERKNRSYEDIEDFVTRHLDFNKKAFESLAKSGALDSFGYTRHTLVENLGDMLNNIKKANKNINKGQLTLFDIGLEKPSNSFCMNELPEYDFLQKCRFEKDATGMYISGHPASEIKEAAKKHGAVDIADILDENSVFENNDKVSIYGVITEITRKVTKNGNPMMILKVEDETESITVMLFDRAIQQYASELHEDGLVFIQGKVRGGGEDSSIMLNKVCEMKETPVILWIATPDTSLINIKKLASDFMGENSGLGDYVYVMSLKTRKPELLGEISVTPEVIQKARIKFGNENIKVTEKKKKKFAGFHPAA